MNIGDDTVSTDVYLAKIIDAAIYSGIVAVVGFVLAVIVGLLLGSVWNGAKYFLFFVGFLQMTIGVVQMWPTDRSELEGDTDPDDVSRVQALVDRLTPTEQLQLPAGERFEPGFKRFLASLALLGISLTLETVFGVAA